MRRWLTLLLLVLMPLQSVWAAASAHCLHEQGGGAQHLGHHAHRHQAEAGAPAADAHAGQDPHGQPALQDYDSDCGSCHLGGVLLLMPAAGLPAFTAGGSAAASPPAALACADPTPIERPNWAAAPAA